MSSNRTGKSPDHDRAVEMVRQGRPLSAIQMATGIPSATIKRWARNAGLTVVMPTMAERLEREERGAEMAKTRRLYRIGITAERVNRPIVSDRKSSHAGPNIKPGGR
jgi:hypothetical protein